MNPTPSPPLPLRDIHLPPEISWWPPAPGYWYLAGLLLLLVIVLLIGRHWYKKGALKRESLARLEQIKQTYQQRKAAQKLSQDLSELLRRIALSSHPRAQVAGLTGEAWLAFLDSQWGNQPSSPTPFQSGPGRSLITAPYQKTIEPETVEKLLKLCKNWIEAYDYGFKTDSNPEQNVIFQRIE
ncbi:MAG: DUF4381 domain-containing protein [Magnetococcales bacterium]|nr:DUF4381 domain-containing protein [Magnetococcales bacterium]